MKILVFLPLLLIGTHTGASVLMAQPAGSFTATGNLATDESFPKAVLLSNGKVLVIGAGAEFYDPSSETFSATGSTNSWYRPSATRLTDGRILIAGGTRAELYDPDTGTFAPTGAMATPRVGHLALLLANGKVLMVGGFTDGKVIPADLTTELYDPDLGTFAPSGSFADAGLAVTATSLADGRVLLTSYYSNLAALYDPATGAFTPTGRPHFQSSTAVLLSTGKVLLSGGIDDLGPDSRAELYDPATGAFSATGNMTVARMDHSATLLGDGTVLIAGGQISDSTGGSALASAEIYDPATGTFQATGNMASPRFGHVAPLLRDGTILIASGSANSRSNPGERAELYHPAGAVRSPALFSLAGASQGAIWNTATGEVVSREKPAAPGDVLSMYCTSLVEGGVIPPQVAIGGRLAEILFFGDAPGYPGYFQVNFRVPSGVAPRAAVSVGLTYLDRPSNEVTIGVR